MTPQQHQEYTMKTMTIRFDAHQHDTIKQLASNQRRSFSQQVHFLIDEGLRKHGAYTPAKATPSGNQPATNDDGLDIDFPDDDPAK